MNPINIESFIKGKYAALLVLMVLAFSLLYTSCYKESFITTSGAGLEFSLDTLRFDTVFTEVGSATRFFKVYNPHDESIRISKITFTDPEQPFFRLNIDGFPTDEIEGLEIRPNDSLYVFAEVSIDPDAPVSISPFVIEQLLKFETNGKEQQVLLEAWGQNANYLPSRFSQNEIAVLSCNSGEVRWDDPRPYVIYGTLLIDSCTLVWPEGTRIFVHGGVANNDFGVYNDGVILVLEKGRIRSEGTLASPVIVQDDRLESDYTGVWGGIRITPGSKGHTFTHTQIQNSIVGIAADSASQLTLDKVTINATSGIGLFARNASITATNCLFYDNGTQSVALTYGGDYQFDYCTLSSFGNDGDALLANNFYCSDPLCLEEVRVSPLQMNLRNCIMVGSSGDEIA
ncbi:MAG: right-handed parallel beta-helix repeat-containing protein, partial [Saprospiraceae bacterium]|nr:right-handed parallel beta-helix repeat-containing protein [Saprospiraceae bacterium]